MGVWVTWLADAARATRYPVIEVAGWRVRGHGPMARVEGVTGHQTGTPNTVRGDYPTLNVVTYGRSDLAGPLCNLGIGRSGTIYVIAAGTGYHAGVSRFAGFTDLNDEFLGIEAEDNGDSLWTDAMLDCYPKLVGSLLRYMNRGVDRYCSHRTCAIPAGRKPDPTGLSDAWMRTEALRWINRAVPPPISDPHTGVIWHTVIAGETLWSISRRYGASVAELMAWNGLTSSRISPKQVLQVSRPIGGRPIISTTQNRRDPEVQYWQMFMNRVFPAYSGTPLVADGEFGDPSAGVCREFQIRSHIPVNGTIDAQTRSALAKLGYRY